MGLISAYPRGYAEEWFLRAGVGLGVVRLAEELIGSVTTYPISRPPFLTISSVRCVM